LEKVNIPEAVTHIGNDTFAGCTRLRQVAAAEVRDEALFSLDARRNARAREAASRLSEKISMLRKDPVRTKGTSTAISESPSGLSTRTPSAGDLRLMATEELWTDGPSNLQSQGSPQLATGELLGCTIPLLPPPTESTGTGLHDNLSNPSNDLAVTGSEDLSKLSNEQMRSKMLDTIEVIKRKMAEKQRQRKLQATSNGM